MVRKSRKNVGKLRLHKTGVYFMSYKGRNIYFSKDRKESRRKHRANAEAIGAGEPLPHGGPKQGNPKPLTETPVLMLREGLAMYVEDREQRMGRTEHALRKSNETFIQCCGGVKRSST